MAQCKLCSRSGWFLSLSHHHLCNSCEPCFQLDLQQRVRIIQDSQKIVESSRSLDTKRSRIQVALDHLKALQNYERHGIETILPPPSEAIRNYERKYQEEIAAYAKIVHEDALAKAGVGTTSKSKIAALSKGLLKLRQLTQHSSSNVRPLTESLQEQIAKVTMSDYLEKARKAEFKGQTKKALEQYYEALYFLKHDDVDDRLQTEHIASLEQKILGLGGSLNDRQPAPVISTGSTPPTPIEQPTFPNDDVLKGYRFFATLHLRTPAAVLLHHRELWTGHPEAMPSYGAAADGIWLPQTKSWADLAGEAGNLDTARRLRAVETDDAMTVASDIGPQEKDGQEYCKFLLGFRNIIESTTPENDKDRLLQHAIEDKPTWLAFA
jgi:hypothetical protein